MFMKNQGNVQLTVELLDTEEENSSGANGDRGELHLLIHRSNMDASVHTSVILDRIEML